MTLPPFVIERPGVQVTVTLEVFEEHGRKVCGVLKLKGRISLPPKVWLRAVRAEMVKIEHIARQAGCDEMRMAGRSWSRILPDYVPFEGPNNGLRKAL